MKTNIKFGILGLGRVIENRVYKVFKNELKNSKVVSVFDKDQKKNVLNRWSSDVRSKISVVTVKGVNGEKAIKLPSTPESN